MPLPFEKTSHQHARENTLSLPVLVADYNSLEFTLNC